MKKLIIAEGLPCSGKSTVSRIIADRLGARYFDEGSGSHPADYEFHAFLKVGETEEFSGDELREIRKAASPRANGLIVPLGRFQGELFQKLLKYKVYDFLPWETERPVMLDKWKEFAAGVGPGEVYVFNCVLLQNPMCETMMRFGFDREVSAGYIGEIAEIIRPLEPMVVYLKNDNIRPEIEKAVQERGEEWLRGVIDYHCGGSYGRSLGLTGFDGYIAALEERQRRELEILQTLEIPYLIVDGPSRGLEETYSEILRMARCQ